MRPFDQLPGEAAELDRRWARQAAIALIIAFLCPLALGEELLFGPTLIIGAPPAHRLLALIPGVLGPLLLLATYKLDGVRRATVVLIGTGLGIILMIATAETATRGPLDWGPGGLPAARAMVVYTLAMTIAFAGLGLLRAAPEHPIGLHVAGIAGAVLLAVHITPLGGRTPLGLVLDPISWRAAWPIPLAIVFSFGFAALCTALLFGAREPVGTSLFALALGLAALLALPLGTLVIIIANFPPLLGMFATAIVKYYGSFIALHALLAAGVLGLARHGFIEADGR